jgi:tetratricopeptide (TPR) repeat protein
VLIERGATAEAGAVLARAFRDVPDHPALWLVRGELCLQEELFDDATAAFQAARAAGAEGRAIVAGLARAENGRAIALSEAGKDSEAAFAFKRAADLDPRFAPPHVNLGALLQRMGRPRRARAHYRRALALHPGNGVAHFNLGLLHRGEGDLAGAERAFDAALSADPPHPHARRELAITCAERGDYAQAIHHFEEELRLSRRPDAWVYANLGLAYARAGDRARAKDALLEALRLDADHAHALTNLAALYAAEGRAREAAVLLRRARAAGNSGRPPASK